MRENDEYAWKRGRICMETKESEQFVMICERFTGTSEEFIWKHHVFMGKIRQVKKWGIIEK